MQNATSDHVAVHTVLGPDTSGPDSRRLLAMLRYALGRGNRMPVRPERLPSASLSEYYSLIAQPLFAEDFLSLVQRPSIIDPHQDALSACRRHETGQIRPIVASGCGMAASPFSPRERAARRGGPFGHEGRIQAMSRPR